MSLSLFKKDSGPNYFLERNPWGASFMQMEGVMDELMKRNWGEKSRDWDYLPKITFHEEDKSYFLAVELPGVRKEDIHLSFKGDDLVICGERKSETKSNVGATTYTEFSYGNFSRVLTVPKDVDKEKISAELNNGILEVVIAKSEKTGIENRKITIK